MHITVLLKEAVDYLLDEREDGCYVDATYGRGGHTQEILKRLSGDAHLLVIDKDPQALDDAHQKAQSDRRLSVHQGGFASIDDFLQQHEYAAQGIQGVLLDLGVSSPQLDQAQRGFSFLRDGPLDMRMDTTTGQTAAQWLATADTQDICDVLRDYGEEKYAWRIAQRIVAHREQTAIETTRQLADLIEDVVPKVYQQHKHPATRSFQAIRIFINQELQELQVFLAKIVDLLAVGGRLVVISFHSLEDRIVKRFIREQEKGQYVPKYIPIRESEEWQPRLKSIAKPIRASQQEIAMNIRSRSAIMRVAQRVL